MRQRCAIVLLLSALALMIAPNVASASPLSGGSRSPNDLCPAFQPRGGARDATGHRPVSADEYPSELTWLASEATQAALQRVHDHLSDSEHVIGTYLDHPGQRLVIVVDPESPLSASAIEGEALATADGDLSVTVELGCAPKKDLEAVKDAILSDQSLVEDGVVVRLDPASSKVVIAVPPGSADKAGLRLDRLGLLSSGDVAVETAQAVLWSRQSDGQPHYGGAGIGPCNCSGPRDW